MSASGNELHGWETWETLGRWKREGARVLTAVLGDGGLARREAEWILRHVLRLDAAAFIEQGETRVETSAGEVLARAFQRRMAGEPLQYVLGVTEFMGLELRTTPQALIPRPETEGLVQQVLHRIPPQDEGAVLDLGTGSGCIVLAILAARSHLRGVAVDISPDALALAHENARDHGLLNRVAFFQGDLFAPLPQGSLFQVIVSNPPYIALEEKPSLPGDVVDFEPHEALFSRDQGLYHLRAITREAPRFLAAEGLLVLEIGEAQGPAVREMLEPGVWSKVTIEKDLTGRERYAMATLK